MAEVKWIKLTTTMFDDEKIKLIESMPEADAILVIWVKLLIQAGKCNEDGYVYLNESMPYTEEMLSALFGRPLNVIRLALETFKSFRMIEISDEGIYINNWHKHQNIDGLDKIREQNRIRAQAYRERKRLSDAPSRDANVTVTLHHEAEKEVDKDKEQFSDEFQKFWDLYPRKEGKPAAYKKFKLAKKAHGVQAVMQATKNYTEDCKGRERRYIKLPATFLGPDKWYEEWIDKKPEPQRPALPSRSNEPSNYYKKLE